MTKIKELWETVSYYLEDISISIGFISIFIAPYLAYLGHPGLAMLLIFFAIMRYC